MIDHRYIIAAIVIALLFLEYRYPYYVNTKHQLARNLTNVTFFCINRLIIWVAVFAFLSHVMQWSEGHSMGLLRQVAMPAWVQMVLAFLLLDLWVYAVHYANHKIPFLWRFHQVHHSEQEIIATSLVRVHPGEQIVTLIGQGMMAVVLGLNAYQLIAYSVSAQIAGFIYHSNIALPEKYDRMIRSVFVTNNMHRVHHLPSMEDSNSNYATVFSWWDRIFGTLRLHDEAEIRNQKAIDSDNTSYLDMLGGLLKAPLKG